MGKVFKQIGDAQEKAAKAGEAGKAAKPASHRPKSQRRDG
jgi:hypothetical protein